MANKNITQLATQSGSADPTSLFYTVTGGNTDKSLPLTVLFNSPAFTGTPTFQNPATVVAGLGLRQVVTAPFTIHVDAVNGVDSSSCGLGTGSLACRTVQQAFNNLATNYDFRGVVPTILGVAGQTFTSGLNLQGGAGNTPFLCGTNQVILDLAGSTISSSTGNVIFLRGYPLWLVLQNMTITATGSTGNLVEVYGGGTHVEFNGGMTFGACPSPYAQLSATRYGRISTRPTGASGGNPGYTISGAGGMFAQAIIGGRIELEGQTFTINSGLTYTQEFVQADGSGSAIELSGLTWTGSNVTGPQFSASKLGEVNTNAQTGSFSVTANTYLPGSVAGQMGFVGGRMDSPGLPTVTGAGTGALIQNIEPAFNLILGTGLPTTNGTTVSSTVVTMATRSGWSNAVLGTNDPGSVSNLHAQWTGPTSTAPGFINITWTATGFDPAGKVIWIQVLQ